MLSKKKVRVIQRQALSRVPVHPHCPDYIYQSEILTKMRQIYQVHRQNSKVEEKLKTKSPCKKNKQTKT